MSNQSSLPVDDVRVAAPAGLNFRDHIPDELEVDLSDAHAVITACPRERESHIGLGLAPKVNWPIVDLVGQCLAELRLLRKVLTVTDHIHGELRHAELLFTEC